ncbi:MAG: acyl-CoA thioesterase [Treponema sp.]|jgi:acyl-CoA thioester hydrolase|nr:acyl-CoA thioesterase [Treponema sp.]
MRIEDCGISAGTEFTVEFYEVDSMEVVWHGNYVNYLERARRALLDHIGYGYGEMKESGYAFPVTGLSLKFIRPLRFGDRVRARAVLEEYENRIRIKYELFNAVTGELTTRGTSTQMAIDMVKGESRFTCPRVFIDRVERLLEVKAQAAGERAGQNGDAQTPEGTSEF